MYSTFGIGECYEISVCGNDFAGCGILNEIVGAEIAYVVLGDSAYRTCSIRIGELFIEKSYRIVELVCVGLEVIKVEYGSLIPVTVECKVGNVKVC